MNLMKVLFYLGTAIIHLISNRCIYLLFHDKMAAEKEVGLLCIVALITKRG